MIGIQNLNFSIGDFQLEDISLTVQPGEYFLLLGRPGAGKSLLLECICGLKRIASGNIAIDSRDMTLLEPRDRQTGYVPQDYALFPHLTVAENIGFGLKRAFRSNIREIADKLGVAHLLNRRIQGLSGGEKQRVALARALAPQPKILLLDEPVSALDEQTRTAVCMELKRLQRETGVTTIHVSHNIEETRMLADKVGILRNGRMVQTGTIEDVFANPCDKDMAAFLRVGDVRTG